ncbi:unnamed protein product [Danaus chrysippus]|uniref:(African queen) hypothetical protein n=1 Tax=Danaus chrysippus TaxID=151541 RepID=A0A8J2VZ44_9NEOP|nr:unnamed protein product [Danaus chrysippus]
MPQIRQNNVSGGKGNKDMFIERNNKICAAGKPTDQPLENISSPLKWYSLQDEVDALISDAIEPSTLKTKFPPIKEVKKRDMRYASIFSEGSELLNPPVKTKMQTLVEDFKNTTYSSYWKKAVGKISDPVPTLPEGFNIYSTPCGLDKRTHDSAYDIILPKNPIIDKTPKSKSPGYQVNRNYCFFNKNSTFGIKAEGDRTGKFMKCCLTDDRVTLGTALKQTIADIQAKFKNETASKLATSIMPNNNISRVPEGFAFGKIYPPGEQLIECLREPSPELPKIYDVPEEYLDFRTTYGDMVRENQEIDTRNMAGIPSGRYFDKDYPITPEGCCKADRTYLPHESDARTCLLPSILTSLGVSHRDLYARRDRKTIMEVFGRAGYKFDEEKFKTIWEMAEKYHSQKWVCYETFRKCLREYEKNQDSKS